MFTLLGIILNFDTILLQLVFLILCVLFLINYLLYAVFLLFIFCFIIICIIMLYHSLLFFVIILFFIEVHVICILFCITLTFIKYEFTGVHIIFSSKHLNYFLYLIIVMYCCSINYVYILKLYQVPIQINYIYIIYDMYVDFYTFSADIYSIFQIYYFYFFFFLSLEFIIINIILLLLVLLLGIIQRYLQFMMRLLESTLIINFLDLFKNNTYLRQQSQVVQLSRKPCIYVFNKLSNCRRNVYNKLFIS